MEESCVTLETLLASLQSVPDFHFREGNRPREVKTLARGYTVGIAYARLSSSSAVITICVLWGAGRHLKQFFLIKNSTTIITGVYGGQRRDL